MHNPGRPLRRKNSPTVKAIGELGEIQFGSAA